VLLLLLSAALSLWPPAAPTPVAAAAPGVRLLLPTAGPSPGGVWEYAEGSWQSHSAGLPAGWTWRGIVASPVNPNHWLLWGDSGSGLVAGDNQIVAASTSLSPLWQTTDGGQSWQPIALPVPPLAVPPANASFTNLIGALLTDGRVAAMARVNGAGEFFGIPVPGVSLWHEVNGAMTRVEISVPRRWSPNPVDLKEGLNGQALVSSIVSGGDA
jgi:hypothetical protein